MQDIIWLGLFLPLVGFLVLMLTSSVIKRQAVGILACSTIFLSFLCFGALLAMYLKGEEKDYIFTLFKWIPVPGINADFTLHLDSLSLLMTLIITGVGFLIHVYSVGYMDHEKDLVRYFAFLNLFVFFMLVLVLAGHLLVLFVGWEGVGLASYLLIGFWYNKPAAAQAATKAFVINRIGDLGLLLGLLLTFQVFGTGDMLEISRRVGQEFAIGAPILTIMTLLYFVGATGKSAQLPLYNWLPDAMEGPTPVSALIHAATMVTAGVYLVVRMHALFLLAPLTMQVIGVIGAVTALFAALCAVGQMNLKRVLAYSTISQLGLMFLACGAGAFYSAMFHLTTHAFVKALLFLSAGNVVHMLHDETDMDKMGGLRKKLPKTAILFLIGVLALSGIPPLATFFSKDLILEQEYLAGFDALFYIGLAASILTAFYLTRAYCLTFTGKPRMPAETFNAIKEVPFGMLVPVTLLGVLAVIGGFLGYTFCDEPLLEEFLSQIGLTLAEKHLSSGFIFTPEAVLAVAGAFLGVGSAALLYTKFQQRLGATLPVLAHAFYLDRLYWLLIGLPIQALSQFVVGFTEPKIFEGAIHAVTKGTQESAYELQRVQSGQIRSYAAWMVVGTVLLIAYFAF